MVNVLILKHENEYTSREQIICIHLLVMDLHQETKNPTTFLLNF